MKFPSISSLTQLIKTVFLRFPLQLIITLSAVVIAWLLTYPNVENEEILLRSLAFCLLAFNFSLSAILFANARSLPVLKNWLLQVLALVISATIMIWLKPDLWQKDIYILIVFVLACHLMVAFASFLNEEPVLSFWHFNKTLFLRILTAGLYSDVIILGLFAALAAIDNLFDVSIKSATYAKVASVVGIGFNTIFFLAGIPEQRTNNIDNSYPKGLKIFTQFVLIPLMTVYLLILLVYELKIIVEWELPKGYVSLLILGYAVFGILSLLLVYPIRNMEENKWIKLFSRFFYIMMLPLLVLLALAIYKRISDYGITEERYMLILLAIWLTGITFYFLLSKKDNIKIIPISLAVCCLISAIGPQSAASVSRHSQTSRLKSLLSQGEKADKSETASVLNYLVDNHGLTAIRSLTTENVDAIQDSVLNKVDNNSYYQARSVLKDTAFGLLKIKDLQDASSFQSRKQFRKKDENLITVSGYETAFQFDSYTDKQFEIKADSIPLTILISKHQVKVNDGKESVAFELDDFCKTIAAKYKADLKYELTLTDSLMFISKESSRFKLGVQLTNFNTTSDAEADSNETVFSGYLLIHKK